MYVYLLKCTLHSHTALEYEISLRGGQSAYGRSPSVTRDRRAENPISTRARWRRSKNASLASPCHALYPVLGRPWSCAADAWHRGQCVQPRGVRPRGGDGHRGRVKIPLWGRPGCGVRPGDLMWCLVPRRMRREPGTGGRTWKGTGCNGCTSEQRYRGRRAKDGWAMSWHGHRPPMAQSVAV